MLVDLAIIGAGPAGMAAAIGAADLGLSVLVLDEQAAPGGQAFRGVTLASRDLALAGDYAIGGMPLVHRFRATVGVTYWPSSSVWHIAPDTGVVSVLRDGASTEITGRRILLATGAQERPVPVPGWTLPGVMTAGAAQIMLKTTGAVPRGKVVLAGQGPLMWLLAVQLLRAGVADLTLLQTTPAGAAFKAFAAGGLWAGRASLGKGLSLMMQARRLGLRTFHHVGPIRAEGAGRVERVLAANGTLPCDVLLLHEGVVPSTHVSQAIGLDHVWDESQLCWRPRVDAWGASSHPRVAVAGDGAGIVGWEASAAAGQLAALDAAWRAGWMDKAARDAKAGGAMASWLRATALRPFLDRLYRPAPEILAPGDKATIVCRCEEVTAGQVRLAARLGATGPNQAKAYLRCGMGACQGRMCGATVAAVIAAERGISIEEAGTLRPRAPFKPLTVGELAGSLSEQEQAG